MTIAPNGSEPPVYGSPWARLGAFVLLDAPAAWLLYYAVAWALGRALWRGMYWAGLPDHTMSEAQRIFYAATGMTVDWLYYALLESAAAQATLGKRAFGLVVADENGCRLSFRRASGRYFSKYLSALPLGIGFLRMMWSERRQAFHDRLAGTLVVRRTSGSQTSCT